MTQTIYYRGTQVPVGCSRLIVDNPFGAKTFLQFDRYMVQTFLGKSEMKRIDPAIIFNYDRTVDLESLSETELEKHTFPLPEGLIPNVNSLTDHQIFGVMTAFFAELNKRQEIIDIAEENRKAALISLGLSS